MTSRRDKTQYDSMDLPPRLPLVIKASGRNQAFTKDARLINAYMEVIDDETWVVKRPGLILADEVASATSGRGVYFWDGDLYSIFNGTLYRNGVSVSSSLDTTGGPYRFSSIRGAIPKLVLGNGKKTYTYTVAGGLSSDLHTIDVDFPIECVKGIGYLGGASYVMDLNGQIWNSAVNSVDTAGSWGAVNYIDSHMDPDGGVFLGKVSVYLVALNEISTEIFYDAGNATGSPLANNQGAKISYGCFNGDSVQRINDRMIWLSTDENGQVQFSMLDPALNHKIISTPAIDRLIQGSVLTTVHSFQLKISGHDFYIFTCPAHNYTIVYDLTTDLWSQWSDTDGNYFPYVAATYDDQRRLVLQHESNGNLYFMTPIRYTDVDDLIVVDIYTPNFDAKVSRRKQLNNLYFIGDKVAGSVLEVRCSDNDYETWSSFRKVPLDRTKPMLPGGGTFYRRAYHLRHRRATPFRLQAVDAQYDVGTL